MAGLTVNEKRALEFFVERLRNIFGNKVVSTVLFGSKAKNMARRNSDVDILIVLKRARWEDREAVYRLTARILKETGVDLAVLVLSQEQERRLTALGSSFLHNVHRESVRLT